MKTLAHLLLLLSAALPAASQPADKPTPACERYAQARARMSQPGPAAPGQDMEARLNGFLSGLRELDAAKAGCESSRRPDAAPSAASCSPSGTCCTHWTPDGACERPFPCARCPQAAARMSLVKSAGQSCSDGGQCGPGETCQDHRCVSGNSCRTDADCPWQQHCQAGACWLGNGGQCSSDFDCRFGNHCVGGSCQGPW